MKDMTFCVWTNEQHHVACQAVELVNRLHFGDVVLSDVRTTEEELELVAKSREAQARFRCAVRTFLAITEDVMELRNIHRSD